MSSRAEEPRNSSDRNELFLQIVERLTRLDLWAKAKGQDDRELRQWIRDHFIIGTLMESVRRIARENPEKWGETCVRIEVSYKGFLDRGF
jgi:hypothetical protein